MAALITRSKEKVDELLPYMSSADAQSLQAALTVYHEHPYNKKELANKKLRALLATEQFSTIADVHPAWILDKLKNEPPRIIGILLRYLPSQHVRYVVENLPAKVQDELPDMIESFAVQPNLLSLIRKKFEQHFIGMHFTRQEQELSFEHIYYLKHQELETLFTDLGIQEMAMALATMSRKSNRMLLNRLPLRKAKELQQRCKNVAKLSSTLCHQARFTILEAAGERIGSEQLFLDLGLAAFARSLGQEHAQLFQYILQKIAPQHGYVLKRSLTQWSEQGQQLSEERRQLILARLVTLAKDAKIEPTWGPLFASNLAQEEMAANAPMLA